MLPPSSANTSFTGGRSGPIGRTRIPLPALGQLCDSILNIILKGYTEWLMPPLPDVHIGALPGTQCLDTAFSAQLFVEKAVDNGSQGAIGSVDIATYYDCLPLLVIVRIMMQKLVPLCVASSMLRLQLSTSVCVRLPRLNVWSDIVAGRTIGGLTGSRTAGFLRPAASARCFVEAHPSVEGVQHKLRLRLGM